ncbi:hypothetical protein BC826DRAFT_1136507 [Russula brevipes]|nr:hypothetical protein BC826DRAFT_1136507 [Russula brevipes]
MSSSAISFVSSSSAKFSLSSSMVTNAVQHIALVISQETDSTFLESLFKCATDCLWMWGDVKVEMNASKNKGKKRACTWRTLCERHHEEQIVAIAAPLRGSVAARNKGGITTGYVVASYHLGPPGCPASIPSYRASVWCRTGAHALTYLLSPQPHQSRPTLPVSVRVLSSSNWGYIMGEQMPVTHIPGDGHFGPY